MIHYYNINHQILADKATQVGQKKNFNSQTIIIIMIVMDWVPGVVWETI